MCWSAWYFLPRLISTWLQSLTTITDETIFERFQNECEARTTLIAIQWIYSDWTLNYCWKWNTKYEAKQQAHRIERINLSLENVHSTKPSNATFVPLYTESNTEPLRTFQACDLKNSQLLSVTKLHHLGQAYNNISCPQRVTRYRYTQV